MMKEIFVRKEGRRVSLPLRILICLSASLGLIIGNGVYGTIDAFSQGKASTAISTYSYVPPTQREPYPLLPPSKVKNVIFLIGDGMGLSQISAARIKAVGPGGRLHIDRMPVTGLVTTHSAKELVTDSAAAATALSTGYKTDNGMVGVLPEGGRLRSILEEAKIRGMATGLIATSTITHATPASFASHVSSRDEEATIATHLLENKVNILLGGGKEFFLPSSSPGSKREDERNLIDEAKRKGYLFVQTREELEEANTDYLLGLFQLGGLTTSPPEPTLAELTHKAISLLSQNIKGFFLMVEGSQIDWASHGNDIDDAIKQTLLFDEAVRVAVDFALEDKHTLVIVTADHETGGMGINGGDLGGEELEVGWTTGGHTGVVVPLYAFGPQGKKFMGLNDNIDIPRIVAKVLGITPFPPEDK